MRDKAAEGTETEIKKPVIPVDGKTLRRSHDKRKGLGALHSVSAWASDFGLSLGQVATDAKSNEITAIPELLKLIDISGAIITIDAMGTQTVIAAQIIHGRGDYVLALKGNQEKLHDAVIEFVDKRMETDFSDCGGRHHMTEETGHGREETRHYIQMPAPKTLPGFSRWKGLLTIGVAILHCIRDGKQTVDTRYYISSLPMGVKQFAHAVRAHWGIENTCHWSLDVTYREDESRIRNEYLRENFAWLNRFTLSLLKQQPDKDSLAMKRRSCGWNDEFLVETLTGITT
jgi:predicted transposase YbfD/YdcC